MHLRRAQLLPKSGVGVVAPWLVIAGKNNPVIRIDLRQLDRVRMRGEADERDERTAEALHDRWSEIVLVRGDLDVGLHIADGPDAALRIVDEAAPWTRENSGAEKPLPDRRQEARDSRPASYGRLVVLSSTPDAEIRSNDELAGYVYELTNPLMLIGRTSDNDIIINHGSISRDHAKVTCDATTGRYSIIDLHASNGLCVNGERCIGVELNHRDVVDLGHVRMRFVGPGEAVDDDWDALVPPDPDELLIVGCHAVIHYPDHIEVGEMEFRIDDVEQLALRGENLPLASGRVLQAAMALLVVTDAKSST